MCRKVDPKYWHWVGKHNWGKEDENQRHFFFSRADFLNVGRNQSVYKVCYSRLPNLKLNLLTAIWLYLYTWKSKKISEMVPLLALIILQMKKHSRKVSSKLPRVSKQVQTRSWILSVFPGRTSNYAHYNYHIASPRKTEFSEIQIGSPFG